MKDKYKLIEAGDTTTADVMEWAWWQYAYLPRTHLALLKVLCQVALVKENNAEDAPVGQVMYEWSRVEDLARWMGTGTSEKSVRLWLWDLQAKYGYITRTPRPYAGEAGRLQRITRVHWSIEDDFMRKAHRDRQAPLRDEFLISAEQIEQRNRKPNLRLLRTVNEVEQL